MSNAHINLCAQVRLKAPVKAVLMCLADIANGSGVCWPANAYISTWTCLSRSTVILAVAELERLSIITVQRTPGRSNVIRIATSKVQELARSTRTQPGLVRDHDRSGVETAAVCPPDEARPAAGPNPSGIQFSSKRRTSIPEDWAPSRELLTWAHQQRPDVDLERCVAVFKLHYAAKGQVMDDWPSAFQAWVLRENVKRPGKGGTPPTAPQPSRRDPVLLKIEADRELAVRPNCDIKNTLERLRADIVSKART